ncbi:accessory Sec system S-layer assembly protein [Fictibacillus iocasae]|uniref:Accessory Sec system S-layer assembly protein n=1 Tax=Fictibacillus iocasae TaxID=2715437 RepID=A0ABW2NRI5_9BACL
MTAIDQTEEVYTVLSYHPEWDVPLQEKYVYQFQHKQLPPLKPNQISIHGTDVIQDDEAVLINAFIRNTLEKAIQFEEVTLLLLNEEGAVLARKTFELLSMGEIPAVSSRPWKFLFMKEDLTEGAVIPETGWKLAFELKQRAQAPSQHALKLDQSWESRLNEAQKGQLENLVKNLPALTPGEVNLMGLEAKFQGEDGSLIVTLLIRNGGERSIELQQIPLIVEDAAGDVAASGAFQLDSLVVEANTSKPWTFIFPSSLVQKSDADLSRWRVTAPSAK